MTIIYKRKKGAGLHEEGKSNGKEGKLHKRRKSTPTYHKEKPIVKDFWKTTSRNLQKRIEKRYLSVSIDDLKQESKTIFPVQDLELITSSLIFLDKEGQPLLYFLKGALEWPFEEDNPSFKALQALEHLAGEYPPPPPKSTDVRHDFKIHPKTHGVYHITLWHANGQENNAKNKDKLTKGAVISADVISAGYKFNIVAEFLHKFTPITQAIGALFEVVHKESYEKYKEKFQNMAENTVVSLLKTSDKSCFFGMAVLVGLACKPHRDAKDAKEGWVADMAFGNFTGGNLEVPQLGCQFHLRQGDVIFMKSALLQHSVSKVKGGLRYGVVYFSHQSLMH